MAKSEMERRVEIWHGSSEAEARTVWAVVRRSVEFVMFWRESEVSSMIGCVADYVSAH